MCSMCCLRCVVGLVISGFFEWWIGHEKTTDTQENVKDLLIQVFESFGCPISFFFFPVGRWVPTFPRSF